MMTLPLAIYTAKYGLAWQYPERDISIRELSDSLAMFGEFPDFDSGDLGFEGMAIKSGRVYLVRCFRAEKWDFRGRDAIYFAVTWLPYEDLRKINKEDVFRSECFCVPMHNPPRCFEVEENCCWEGVYEENSNDILVFRRRIGERNFVRMLRIIDDPIAPSPKRTSARQRRWIQWRQIMWWVIATILTSMILGAFLFDVVKRKERNQDDGSRENVGRDVGRDNFPDGK